ncbi:long-chain fatty acid--CoA ligase [bacterium]|nr:long-chain fatty acid--CoA ligase [bacterium]
MNIGEWTTKWARRYPDEPCIKYGDLVLSKKEFHLRTNQTANAFKKAGVKKGNRVAVLMGNSNVFLEILFGLAKLGAIMVPLNFRLSVPELDFIVNNSEPMLMVYSPEFLTVVDELRPKVPTVQRFICEMDGGSDNDLHFEKWIQQYSDEDPKPDEEPTLDDPHIIMYTSGTTGRPKGAVITQGNTQWNAINCIHMYSFESQDVGVCCAPLFHIGALNASATPSLYAGCLYVIQRFFDPSGILKIIEKERATSMFGIPIMFLMMSQMPEFEQTDLASLRFFIAGGSPCPKSLIETYLKKGVNFNQGYGLTETATAVTALRTSDALRKIGSCGKPVFHVDIKIVDLNGNETPTGEMGEILVKGPNVIKEYWKRPDDTAGTIVNGWLYTGDMGYIDEENYLYIVDRRKDMYISGGENVYPAEVEDVLMSFNKIADAGVIGIPDQKWGESGLAVVVKTPNAEVTEEEIIDFCKGKLAKYKIPKKVEFTAALPRTLTGKILKKDMRAMYIK